MRIALYEKNAVQAVGSHGLDLERGTRVDSSLNVARGARLGASHLNLF